MSILVWILQFMLAFAFLAAGGMKLTRAREQLAERMGRVEDFSDTMVKVIGGLEVLAGIGLIVPTLVNVAPVLAPLAAVGLVPLMVGATESPPHPRPPTFKVEILTREPGNLTAAHAGRGEQQPRGIDLVVTDGLEKGAELLGRPDVEFGTSSPRRVDRCRWIADHLAAAYVVLERLVQQRWTWRTVCGASP